MNILDAENLIDIFKKNNIIDVIHLSTKSHVDHSIISPLDFLPTNYTVEGAVC